MTFENNNKSPWGNLGDKKPNGGKPTLGSLGGGSSNSSSGGGGGNDKIIDFEKFFKKPDGGSGGGSEITVNLRAFIALLVVAIVGWGLTGFYKVDASEEGTVLRFGKFHRTASEGLRYHLPAPIEKVFIVKKTVINSVDIGFRGRGSEDAQAYGSYNRFSNDGQDVKQLSESLMITGDTNIADVSFTVQWRIKNSFEFLFNITNPVETVKSVAESSMREVIGRSMFAASMTTKRNEIENDVKDLIQHTLDLYKAGIEIYVVNLNDFQNPAPVMPAFLDVETAKQDKETAINKAKSYENSVVPKARGESRKLIQEAEAYKQEVVAIATGDASRFEAVYKEYAKAKDVTKKRIYLETMQEVYGKTQKLVVDGKAGNGVVPYLPLSEFKK